MSITLQLFNNGGSSISPVILCEGCVHVIISNQQLLYQRLISYSGNEMNYLVLHLLTFGVQLLLTGTEKKKLSTMWCCPFPFTYMERWEIKIIARAKMLKHKVFVVLDYYMHVAECIYVLWPSVALCLSAECTQNPSDSLLLTSL